MPDTLTPLYVSCPTCTKSSPHAAQGPPWKSSNYTSMPSQSCSIPDMEYIKLGFPADIDAASGVEKVKTAGISQENQQRAKCLTAPAEILSRANRDAQLELAITVRENRAKAKVDRKCREARDIVNDICANMGVEPSEDNVALCEMKHLASLKAPQLKLFTIDRHETYDIPSKYPKLYHPKNALEQALNGERNAVSVAYEVRGKRSRLLAAAAEADNEDETNGNQSESVDTSLDLPTPIQVTLYPSNNNIKPSTLLANSNWIDSVRQLFDSQGLMIQVETFDTAMADALFTSLSTCRLRNHLRLKVKLSKQSHWCWTWAQKNLSVVAAYMILFSHSKKDITRIHESESLLSHPNANKFLLCTNNEGNLQGCYLYYNNHGEKFIRSGKVTGNSRSFITRHLEHKKGAGSNNASDSTFYDVYPTENSSRAVSAHREGYFEQLEQYVAAGFKPSVDTMTIFQKDYNDCGIFFYSDEERALLEKANFKGRTNGEKYLDIVSYLFELGYDLALSRTDNVSSSPGFEAFGVNL